MTSEKASEPKPVEKPPAVPAAWSPFGELRARMDQLFEDFGHGWMGPSGARSLIDEEPFNWLRGEGGNRLVDVKVEATETDKTLEIDAELPGLDDKDVEVSFSDGVLTIKGEKKVEREEKEKDYRISERRYGSFVRSFTVPRYVDDGKIEAHFDKGILKVSLPKRPEAQAKTKKIPVTNS